MKPLSFFRYFILLLTILLLSAACTQNPSVQIEPEETPTPGEALRADAEEYARQFGVEPEEAIRRLELQDEIGELDGILQKEEPETFAGLWIQHEPDFRVVVAFTQDGEQAIQPYLEGKSWADLVELKTFPHSLREMEIAQQQALQIANQLGISISGGIYVQENRVTVEVGNPELFVEEVRAAGLEWPEIVEVVAFDPDNLSDTLRGEVETYEGPDGRTIYFPKQPPTNVYLDALFIGKLILDPNGCLLVEGETGGSALVLWHYDSELRVQGDRIEILNGEGEVVARVGETVRMGGGESSASAIIGLPLKACPNSYWALGNIEPESTQPSPNAEENQVALETLSQFFEFLHDGQYEQAAELYSGSYEMLLDANPNLDPEDHAALLKNGCEINGLQCLRLYEAVLQEQSVPNEFHFLVEFENDDGTRFVRGPCCGATETEMPSEWQFPFIVKRIDGQFLVMDLPVYVP